MGVALSGYAPGALDPRVVRRLGLAFTTDSRRFVTTDPNGVLGLWEVELFRQIERLPVLGSNLWGVALSPDGRWLAVGDAAQKVSIWDWTERRAVTNLALPFVWFGHLHFSRSGNYLLARVIFQEVMVQAQVWRTSDWQEIPLTKDQSERLWSLDLSPDDRLLATGYANGAVRLWGFPTGECEATFTNHAAGVYDLRFSPDGRLLVSSSWDTSVRLWDVVARRASATLRGHFQNVWGAAFSPDGRRLATSGNSSRDGVILWDVGTRRELLALPAKVDFFMHVTFSPGGNTVAATTMDGVANFWHALSWEEIERSEKKSLAP